MAQAIGNGMQDKGKTNYYGFVPNDPVNSMYGRGRLKSYPSELQ